MKTYRLVLLVLMLGLGGLGITAAQAGSTTSEEAQLWQWLRNGEAVALMRHALAPGTGDPTDFTLGNCATQRNLSAEGREQARAIGERFRRNGIVRAHVYSSHWCRCLDTARLLDLGDAQAFDGLNSFFRDRGAEPEHTAKTRAHIEKLSVIDEPPLVLVTHQVNITALTGIFPRSGEIVVLRSTDAGLQVLGRITNP